MVVSSAGGSGRDFALAVALALASAALGLEDELEPDDFSPDELDGFDAFEASDAA
jgi:hypothetical protein